MKSRNKTAGDGFIVIFSEMPHFRRSKETVLNVKPRALHFPARRFETAAKTQQPVVNSSFVLSDLFRLRLQLRGQTAVLPSTNDRAAHTWFSHDGEGARRQVDGVGAFYSGSISHMQAHLGVRATCCE